MFYGKWFERDQGYLPLDIANDDWHVARGARMVEFAGWAMPVQYTSIIDEHVAPASHTGTVVAVSIRMRLDVARGDAGGVHRVAVEVHASFDNHRGRHVGIRPA